MIPQVTISSQENKESAKWKRNYRRVCFPDLTSYSIGIDRLISGYGLCSKVGSDPLQSEVSVDVEFGISLLLVLLSTSPWFCIGI